MKIKLCIPDRQTAKELVLAAEKNNPGPWGDHSRMVASCAELIAARCESMDTEGAYILGLLHDIGRHFGTSHFGHISDGYRYMMELGFPDAARICLSHSFQYQDIRSYTGSIDVKDDIYNAMKQILDHMIYDDYDRLIQLCDCLAVAEGVTLIEKRLVDVTLRYGFCDLTIEKWKTIFSLKDYFEAKAGGDIYDILKDIFVVR